MEPTPVPTPLLERTLLHWKTSAAGVALTGIGYYVLNSWHCQLPEGAMGWMTWAMAAGPAVLGLLSKDH